MTNIADPTPSIILSSTQKRMNIQPDGMRDVNLGVQTQRKPFPMNEVYTNILYLLVT